MNRSTLFALALLVVGIPAAFAVGNWYGSANTQMDHSAMPGMGGPRGDQGAASLAFAGANAAMHGAMDIDYSGNADVDFARGMIAHHEGAVEMAKIVLEHGTDPEIRKLAGEIIAAQQPEIDFMTGWLSKQQ
jgi:uncharacterized protein (DUF305 family)